jgi:hypothetical protein
VGVNHTETKRQEGRQLKLVELEVKFASGPVIQYMPVSDLRDNA